MRDTGRMLMAAVALMAAACGGTGEAPQPGTLTAAEQLTAAKVKADTATSIHLSVRSRGVPSSANGVLGADGSGTHAPAFKGTLDVRVAGFQAKVGVVAVDKVLYLKLPFSTEFVPADPKEYAAPDPARLFAKQGGISSLLTATVNPVKGKKARVGSDLLQTISGTLPGASVSKLLSVGAATKTYQVTYGITEPGGELRAVTMTGLFYQGATSTYTLTLDKYGAPVDIRKP